MGYFGYDFMLVNYFFFGSYKVRIFMFVLELLREF